MTVMYEINTLVWLRELSTRYDRPVTLGDVPEEAWDEVAVPGVDTVWLMGVWERSPADSRSPCATSPCSPRSARRCPT